MVNCSKVKDGAAGRSNSVSRTQWYATTFFDHNFIVDIKAEGYETVVVSFSFLFYF